VVEVELKIVASHGKAELRVVTEHSATCPMCGETVYVDVPKGETA
jgi:hypothetical protein